MTIHWRVKNILIFKFVILVYQLFMLLFFIIAWSG